MYLPEFLAMYNIRQSREYLTAVTQNQAPDIESQIEQAVGGFPETAEEAQDYLNGAWQGMVDGRGAVNLDLFRMANLKSIIEGASIDGTVRVFRGVFRPAREQFRACTRKQWNTVAVRRGFGASPIHLRHKGHGSSRKGNYAGAER